jgi:hypothetical protein
LLTRAGTLDLWRAQPERAAAAAPTPKRESAAKHEDWEIGVHAPTWKARGNRRHACVRSRALCVPHAATCVVRDGRRAGSVARGVDEARAQPNAGAAEKVRAQARVWLLVGALTNPADGARAASF